MDVEFDAIEDKVKRIFELLQQAQEEIPIERSELLEQFAARCQGQFNLLIFT